MQYITIDWRYRGPPASANGGYVCGLVASAMGGSGEVTLRAPPPLSHPLKVVRRADGSVELRNAQALLATGRLARLDIAEIPAASFLEAEDAARRSPYSDQRNHNLPGCFVCGPERAADAWPHGRGEGGRNATIQHRPDKLAVNTPVMAREIRIGNPRGGERLDRAVLACR